MIKKILYMYNRLWSATSFTQQGLKWKKKRRNIRYFRCCCSSDSLRLFLSRVFIQNTYSFASISVPSLCCVHFIIIHIDWDLLVVETYTLTQFHRIESLGFLLVVLPVGCCCCFCSFIRIFFFNFFLLHSLSHTDLYIEKSKPSDTKTNNDNKNSMAENNLTIIDMNRPRDTHRIWREKKYEEKWKKKRQKKEISIDLEATGQIRQRYTIDRETKKQKKKLHHTILREREEQTIKINDLRKKY